MGISIRIGALAIGRDGTSVVPSWSSFWYTLKSGAIWYRRETNTAGGYFILWYSSDSGGTWENLMTLDLTEDSVIIDLTHVYIHQINGTAYEVVDGVEVIYST